MSSVNEGALIRAKSAKAIDAVINEGQSLNTVISNFEKQISPDGRALLRMFCFGVLRFFWRLDSQVSSLIDRPIRKRDRIIHFLLMLGIFQLTNTRVATHAAVLLTVEATRLLNHPKKIPFVNAVLRRFINNKNTMNLSSDELVVFNHPRWLIDCLKNDWPDRWQDILNANNERAPMWLRVNPNKMDVNTYLKRLAKLAKKKPKEIGITHKNIKNAICLKKPWAINDLPGFDIGNVSIQDGAAQIAAPWLLNNGADNVLDACAAPGGKTGHILEISDSTMILTAVDSDTSRTKKIKENLKRLGLNANVIVGNTIRPKQWWNSKPFNQILLDAPCSGSGVIRRHPDIKHLRRRTDINSLAAQQIDMLEALWPLLAPGGRLLYVTCSVIKAENDDVISHFKKRFHNINKDVLLPNNNIRDLMYPTCHGFQILPGKFDMDGFYFCCLEKAT